MNSYFGGILEAEGRQHPWTVSARNPNCKYYDFKKTPELIPTVLEEFKPWDHHEAILRFYQLITWLNGEDSKFESSDCRFDGVKENTQKDKWPKKQACHGALVVLYRNLKYNLSEDSRAWSNRKLASGTAQEQSFRPSKYLKWLAEQSEVVIKQINPEFLWGCIGVHYYHVFYLEASTDPRDNFGYQVVYRFWAWGDTEEEIMGNVTIVVESLFTCFKTLSGQVRG